LPYATNFDNLCIVDGKNYIGKYKSPGILEYNPDTDTWVDLPTPTKAHGTVSLNGKLTLVGNESTSPISKICVWDNDTKQWTEPYPPKQWTERYIPITISTEIKCASYLHYLIIV
jgi:hypothetical protein